MTMPAGQPPPLSSWQCHTGDVAFTVTAPTTWAEIQRARLTEFLTGPPHDLTFPRFTLAVNLDDGAFRRVMLELVQHPVVGHIEPIPGVVLLEARGPSGRRCYAVAVDGLEHHAGAYAVTVHGRNIDLLLNGGSARGHRYPLRLMREAMLRTYEDAGGIIFHAAGIDLGGSGVMICGPRAAGKTSTLACLLRRPAAALLSNDRLILHSDRMIAVPLPVPTALGTIRAFPELHNTTTDVSGQPNGLNAAFGTTVKHPFSARGFASAFGAGLTPASTLRLVLVPHLTDTADPADARRLSTGQARELLTANCFTPRDEFWVRPWLVARQQTDGVLRRHAATAVEHIAATVPCVAVSFGVRNPIRHLERALVEIVGGIR